MATGTSIDGQIGFAAESTYGTGVTVTRFFPLISETLKKTINPSESAAQIATAQVLRSTQWKQGAAVVGGDTQFELYDQSFGLLMRATFGTVNTSGTVHKFWPTAPTVSLTTQVGIPTVYGSIIPFTYTGCIPKSVAIAVKADSIVTAGITWVAQEESMGTALASASYATNLTPWHARYGTLSIDGTVVPVRGFTLNVNNNLDDGRRFLGATILSQPLRNNLAEYTGTFDAEWGNPSSMNGTLLYNRYLNGTEGTLVFGLVSGTLNGTITANVRFDGTSPDNNGRGIPVVSVPFKCVEPAGGTAIVVQLMNNDTTA